MAAMVRVWDPLVRLFHWSLVASFALAWFTADGWEDLHEWSGYAAVALIGFRVLWGLFGPHYARFAQFVQGPGTVAAYLKSLWSGREHRYLGHNPAGGAMVVALILSLSGLCLTGWLYTTDAYWGVAWVETAHEQLSNLLLALIGLHVAGVILASIRHHENLVRAMVTGRKRVAAGGDVA